MLETEVLPNHPDPDFEVVVFHCERQARTPAEHTQLYGLSYPVVLDYDSELFRRLRLPDHVFPLNVVLDRQDSIVYLGPDLDDAVRAAETALEN